MNAKDGPPTLLTFAPMLDSEFDRFLLVHYAIKYKEEAHLPVMAALIANFRGGTDKVPMFTGGGVCITNPKDLADHFDTICTPEKRLTPTDAAQRAEVENYWPLFYVELAGGVAISAYYFLLPHRSIMMEPFTRGIPWNESLMLHIGYPVFRALLNAKLKLSPDAARDGVAKVRRVFDVIDKTISDGRHYLVGGKLSLADIALATSAAPYLLPPCFDAPMPPFESIPADMKSIMVELRARPTAKFINAIYQKHRGGG